MSLASVLSLLQEQICWRTSPNVVQLALALLLLAGAALGPRLMAGNRRWVRGVIALAGLAVLAIAVLQFGEKCRKEDRRTTLEILQQAVGGTTPEPAAPAALATSGPVAVAPQPKPRCPPGSFDGRGFEPPNFYAGPDYLTYDRMLRDLHPYACRAVPALDFGIRNSLGTVDIMWVINGPANAAWGLVQGDIKLFLQSLDVKHLTLLGLKSDAPTAKHLQDTVGQMVLRSPMHLEAVHVISNKPDVRRFADLRDRRVLVPKDSQGSVISAINLLRLHGLPTTRLEADANALEQLARVIDGQANAVVITSGAPARLIAAIAAVPIERRRDLHFVEVDPRVLTEVYRMEPVHYAGWQATPVDVPMVRALWVGWDFSARQSPLFKVRCSQTRQLETVLRTHLPALQADRDAHPAWKTVDPAQPVKGWPTSTC